MEVESWVAWNHQRSTSETREDNYREKRLSHYFEINQLILAKVEATTKI